MPTPPGARQSCFAVLGLLGLALAACQEQPQTAAPDAFSASGRLIAYSGGEAGAVNACFTCHGLKGEGNGAGAPRLAGLSSGYLVKQMQDYADGRRQHPAMHLIASKLSLQDRLAVAEHYARLPAPPASSSPRTPTEDQGAVLYHRGDPARGLRSCAACHGVKGEGGGVANPPLAGQPAAYLEDQLHRWRSGKRQNDPGRIMLAISQRLTEQEMRAVSAYSAALAPPASVAAPATAP